MTNYSGLIEHLKEKTDTCDVEVNSAFRNYSDNNDDAALGNLIFAVQHLERITVLQNGLIEILLKELEKKQ